MNDYIILTLKLDEINILYFSLSKSYDYNYYCCQHFSCGPWIFVFTDIFFSPIIYMYSHDGEVNKVSPGEVHTRQSAGS